MMTFLHFLHILGWTLVGLLAVFVAVAILVIVDISRKGRDGTFEQ